MRSDYRSFQIFQGLTSKINYSNLLLQSVSTGFSIIYSQQKIWRWSVRFNCCLLIHIDTCFISFQNCRITTWILFNQITIFTHWIYKVSTAVVSTYVCHHNRIWNAILWMNMRCWSIKYEVLWNEAWRSLTILSENSTELVAKSLNEVQNESQRKFQKEVKNLNQQKKSSAKSVVDYSTFSLLSRFLLCKK